MPDTPKTPDPPQPSAGLATQQDRRLALEQAICGLSDEAFGYLAMALWPRPPMTTRHMVWPDGLGGFLPDSQSSITFCLDAATRFCTQGESGFKEETN